MTQHFWTCRGCSQRWPRRKALCTCGRRRPAARKPKHMRALEQPYEWWEERYGSDCNICGAEAKSRRLHRDHDHRTGKSRGILCFRCNVALRPYMDEEWLERALAYVRRAAA